MIPLPAPMLLAVAAAVLVACTGTPTGTADSFTGPVLGLAIKDRRFSTDTLEVPAGTPFRILLENRDGYNHNLVIATGESQSSARAGRPLYEGPLDAGPDVQINDVPVMAAGSYWFFCRPHPSMNGTLTVR